MLTGLFKQEATQLVLAELQSELAELAELQSELAMLHSYQQFCLQRTFLDCCKRIDQIDLHRGSLRCLCTTQA